MTIRYEHREWNFPVFGNERMPRGMAALVSPPDDDGERQVVVIQNLSFDSHGRVYKLTQGRLRRWWQSRRGWTHFAGEHISQ